MSHLPTREEILEKYRDQINADDFAILATNDLSSPSQLQKEGAWLEYLGPIKGAYIYLKRSLQGVISIIVVCGGFIQGLEYIDKYSRIACEKIQQVVQVAYDHYDQPATKYVLAVRDPAHFDRHKSIELPSNAWLETTTTTTTTQPPQQHYELPIGSSVVPYSESWPNIS